MSGSGSGDKGSVGDEIVLDCPKCGLPFTYVVTNEGKKQHLKILKIYEKNKTLYTIRKIAKKSFYLNPHKPTYMYYITLSSCIISFVLRMH
jgi:hypothetical protein